MSQQHPITPPPELVEQWRNEWIEQREASGWVGYYIATQAAQWGADQELEACIDVLGGQWEWDLLSQCTGWKEFRDQSEEILRASRRPKPSLKVQALHELNDVYNRDKIDDSTYDTIRRALNELPDN